MVLPRLLGPICSMLYRCSVLIFANKFKYLVIHARKNTQKARRLILCVLFFGTTRVQQIVVHPYMPTLSDVPANRLRVFGEGPASWGLDGSRPNTRTFVATGSRTLATGRPHSAKQRAPPSSTPPLFWEPPDPRHMQGAGREVGPHHRHRLRARDR